MVCFGHVYMRLKAAAAKHQGSSNLRIVRSEKPEHTSLALVYDMEQAVV